MSLSAERRRNLTLSIPPEASNIFYQTEHNHHEKITNARITKAQEKRISMLTRILEPACSEPFYFLYITAKDGTATDDKARHDFKKCLLHINKMSPKPAFIVLCGGFIDNEMCDEDDVLARKLYLEEELSCLDQRIKVLHVASSGDFKSCLSEDSIEKYRLCFGDDFYEFWVRGVAFLVVNTAYYTGQLEDAVLAMKSEQNDWIDSQLLQQQIFQAKRTIIFQDSVPSGGKNENLSAKDMDKDMLEDLLIKYNLAGVSHLLCRQNPSFEKDESERSGLEILPNEINDSDHWFVKLVKISSDEVLHESFNLQGLPEQVYL